MNLSVAGQTLVVPIYVNPTAGPATALGAYNLKICLPPWDVPVGTPGRAFEGAQLLDAKFTVNKIFTTPTGAGVLKWETLFTPYNPGKGTPNLAGTFEARAFVPIPILPRRARASYVKKTNTWKLSGKATEGGLPVVGLDDQDRARPRRRRSSRPSRSAKTGASGTLDGVRASSTPKKTTYFQVSALGRRARLHGDGLSEPADAVRARRLRHRDALAVVGEERRRQAEALDVRIAQGSGPALTCRA